MAKFRLLRGIHQEGGATYFPQEGKNIIDSKSDLCKLNAPNSRRFERIFEEHSDTSSQPTRSQPESDDGLEDLTISELKKKAQEEGIDLGTATKKEEIINTIRSVLQLQ